MEEIECNYMSWCHVNALH